jgi:hypothetical protein
MTTWPLPRLSQGCSKRLRCYVPRAVAALRCGQIPRSNIPGASVPIGPSNVQAPSRAPSKLQIFALLPSSSHHRQQTKHYLTAGSTFNDEPVFALRVDETRPIAGHPIWICSF